MSSGFSKALAAIRYAPWMSRELSQGGQAPMRMRFSMRRLRHRLRLAYHWWLRTHTEHQQFFVIATPRSGSTLLIDLLQSLPGVDCQGEVLLPTTPIGLSREEYSPEAGLSHLRQSLQTLAASARGCKLMLYQLRACGLSAADLHQAFPAARYIVLYRESLADQYVSDRCAQATRQWTMRPGETRKQVRVSLDRTQLEWFCRSTQQSYQDWMASPWLRDCSVVLSYEELVADPRHWIGERICPLLGVPPAEPRTQFRKQNPQPLAERVLNYADVADILEGPHCRQRFAWSPTQNRRAASTCRLVRST